MNEHDTPALARQGRRRRARHRRRTRTSGSRRPPTNGGLKILRRGYSFSDGIEAVTGELDAGLFFIAFQRDPREQFIPLQTPPRRERRAQRVHRARGQRRVRRPPRRRRRTTTSPNTSSPDPRKLSPTVVGGKQRIPRALSQLLARYLLRGVLLRGCEGGVDVEGFERARGRSAPAARRGNTRDEERQQRADRDTTTIANTSATRVPLATLVRSACCRIAVSCGLVEAGGR